MLYIIDGYNFLYSTNLIDLHKPVYVLINIFNSIIENDIKKQFLLIMDGYSPNYYNYKDISNNPNLSIIFSYEIPADEIIQQKILNLKNKNEITLVSNDKQLQIFANNNQIKYISIDSFENFLYKKLKYIQES